jgi:hypothetical protein
LDGRGYLWQRRIRSGVGNHRPSLLARIAPDLPDHYLQGLLSLKSMGAVVMVLSLNHELFKQGYYWYNIPKSAGFRTWRWSSIRTLCRRNISAASIIIYIGDYLEPSHEYFQLSKEALLERFMPVSNGSTPISIHPG